MVQASAPGKCILFGEHAVVYGQPAVAVAIDQRMSVSLALSDDWRIDGRSFHPQRHPHVEALRQRLWDGGPPLSVKILGDIPAASGLGSSAALSVAASAALRCAKGRQIKNDDWAEGWTAARPNNVYDGPWEFTKGDSVEYGAKSVDEDECAILTHAVEAHAQGGRASPMDSSTCAHGGCIVLSDKVEDDLKWLYSRKLNDVSWEVHSVNLGDIDDVWLVIGSTEIHAPTSEQVAKVAKLLENQPEKMREIETIGIVARRGIAALMEGDMESVGRAMSENHLLLRSIGVSCPELEALITAAAPTSLGVKLTGAGGGGCMIALTRNPKLTSEAIELAGGRTLISTLGAAGMKVDKEEDSPLWNPFEQVLCFIQGFIIGPFMNDEDRLTVVNVVASTRVAEELDLPDIAIQLNCEYEPEQFPGVVYRVSDPKLAILMFRSGRAVCTGGKDEDNIHTGIERMINDLRSAGITTWDLKDVEIEVQNMVATYALHYPEDYDGNDKFTGEPLAGVPRKLNLNNLTFHLPFDKVEYEPEQFPGLIYRLDYPKVVCLIFGSGKMVITGARAKDEILEAVEIIKDELADLL